MRGRGTRQLSKPKATAADERVLQRIDDTSARKIVVMAKWERGELSRLQACRLIRRLGLVEA